jgi:hypothetical protein
LFSQSHPKLVYWEKYNVLPLLDNLGNLTKLDADGVNGGNKKSKAHPCNRIIQTINEIGGNPQKRFDAASELLMGDNLPSPREN